ncbi:uncharacterized protein C8Q71DRAFT_239191 [Rhodofomes roseus]|uniref:Uncharacterized protein n=1 Tax=Rhodofomes roseus TaxID=34475 RepID=A0ABQ8KVS4_9APHY|nr:uncharacterized protein C8Q71DRAFT_239191 [Rhodofomes roseus]KAH9843182.1 hypothetical protein C8Q71DRAFT_239191 [Rhodofomes roseus]
MPQPSPFTTPRSQPIPFPSSAASHARDPWNAFREGSSSSSSAQSMSSRGSSDMVFHMDPESTTPGRRPYYQPYGGGHAPAYLPQTSAAPPPFPNMSTRCSGCSRQFIPRSDVAARLRLCEYCRAPPRAPVQHAAPMDRGRQYTERSRREHRPRYASVTSDVALYAPNSSNTRRQDRHKGIRPTGPAPAAQPVGTDTTVMGRFFPAALAETSNDALLESLGEARPTSAPHSVVPRSSAMRRSVWSRR